MTLLAAWDFFFNFIFLTIQDGEAPTTSSQKVHPASFKAMNSNRRHQNKAYLPLPEMYSSHNPLKAFFFSWLSMQNKAHIQCKSIPLSISEVWSKLTSLAQSLEQFASKLYGTTGKFRYRTDSGQKLCIICKTTSKDLEMLPKIHKPCGFTTF